jgi:hypothetical protein
VPELARRGKIAELREQPLLSILGRLAPLLKDVQAAYHGTPDGKESIDAFCSRARSLLTRF